MHLRLLFLSVALGSPLLAQAPGPVQLVGTGNARPQFADAMAPSRIQNTVGALPARTGQSTPSFQQYLANRSREREQVRATSPAAAEAWVRQYSPTSNEATIDPATGMPQYTATVALRHTSSESGGSERVVPHFVGELLRNFMFFSGAVPLRGGLPGKK